MDRWMDEEGKADYCQGVAILGKNYGSWGMVGGAGGQGGREMGASHSIFLSRINLQIRLKIYIC